MKKITLILTIAILAILTACSGKYDQTVVDQIVEKEEPTDQDYIELIKQANYALDDAEKASDFEQWFEENEKEATTMYTTYLVMKYMYNADGLSESVAPIAEKYFDRFDKFSESLPD